MLILPRVQVTKKLLKNIRFRNLYGHKILMKCVLIYGTDVPGFHHALLRPPTYTTWTVLLVQHSYLNHVHQTYITPITKPLPGLIQLLTPTIGNFFQIMSFLSNYVSHRNTSLRRWHTAFTCGHTVVLSHQVPLQQVLANPLKAYSEHSFQVISIKIKHIFDVAQQLSPLLLCFVRVLLECGIICTWTSRTVWFNFWTGPNG